LVFIMIIQIASQKGAVRQKKINFSTNVRKNAVA
jgi:hypothetical protein